MADSNYQNQFLMLFLSPDYVLLDQHFGQVLLTKAKCDHNNAKLNKREIRFFSII